ncbi:Sugar or nucleoside kinase, ribokinase family [Lachnospiraceae bacterium]|nr:Sugar or nucleoside kinase, ribokinase family [Lachnospiraceae bacterium]
MSKVRILGTGVATMDIYPDQGRMYPGGNEYNVSCNAVFRDAEAGFLGVFADDQAGKLLEDTLKDMGVDTSMSHHEKGSSGYSLVRLKEDGDRVFLDWNQRGVTDLHPISFTDEELDYIRTFDVISMGRLACVPPEMVKRLHERDGISICYDFHAAFTHDDIDAIAPHVKYGFFSCSHLSEDKIHEVLKKTVDLGCSIAIGTRGCDPVIAYDGEQFYRHEVVPVESTDALGAGDSFIGAFLADYLSDSDSETPHAERVKRALAAAADHAATVVVKEGSIGIGFDFDPPKLTEVINIGH